MNSYKTTLQEVMKHLDPLPLKGKVEVLANAFLKLGMHDIIKDSNKSVSSQNIFDVVLEDVKANGETISNSLARQGLLLLSWIDKEKI